MATATFTIGSQTEVIGLLAMGIASSPNFESMIKQALALSDSAKELFNRNSNVTLEVTTDAEGNKTENFIESDPGELDDPDPETLQAMINIAKNNQA